MKSVVLALAIFALALPLAAQDADFKELFDGKSLKGGRPMKTMTAGK